MYDSESMPENGATSASGVSGEVKGEAEVSAESAVGLPTEKCEFQVEDVLHNHDMRASGAGATEGIGPLSDMAADDDDADDDDAVPSNEICVGNREGESDLILAVRANDCDRIQRLVWRGCDCNAVCKWDGAPCTVRVEREDFRKQLQMMGYAALHVAAIHSSLKTIKCLLSLGSDVNVRDKNERTALQLAVAVNRPKVARCLIDAGAEINTRSVSGRSPLFEAVMNVSLNLTQMLLKAGANADLRDKKGTLPLYAVIGAMAGRNENQETGQAIVQCLIDAGCEVDGRNPAGASPLMLAAGLKNTPVIHMLVAAGADVNLADRDGRTPFYMSTEGQRNLSAVRALMQYGAATHTPDNRGQTPLSKMVKFGSVAILRLLLSADAVPHSYDILTAPRIVQLRQYLPEFDDWLHKEFHEPRTLRRLCREVIRDQMSPHNLSKVKDLGLPQTLNTYILGDTDSY